MLRFEAHIADLTAFVERLRADRGPDYRIPFFDPWDGGVKAEFLFLLEAPGPKAMDFISRNNPDETAKNMFELTREAGIDRRHCVMWNVVPWYCHTARGTNRNPSLAEVNEGVASLSDLLKLLPKVRTVALMGRKAQRGEQHLRKLHPGLTLHLLPHPGQQNLNRNPGNRGLLLKALREMRQRAEPD